MVIQNGSNADDFTCPKIVEGNKVVMQGIELTNNRPVLLGMFEFVKLVEFAKRKGYFCYGILD